MKSTGQISDAQAGIAAVAVVLPRDGIVFVHPVAHISTNPSMKIKGMEALRRCVRG